MKELSKIPTGIIRRRTRSIFSRLHTEAFELLPNGGEIVILDVGAAGEIEPRWKPYEKFLHYVGFEPDARSRSELIKNNNSRAKEYEILPYAVWDSNIQAEFNLCRKPRLSSLLVPNREFLDSFPNSKRFDVLHTESINVVKIDDSINLVVDFIKVDIQGAGLNALKGACNTISDSFGLEMEVEFLPIYEEQPLFGEVTEWLAERGFDFIDFVNLARWERSHRNDHGQCVWGDALYLKSPENINFEQQSVDRISAYLGVLLIYRRFDLLDASFDIMRGEKRDEFSDFGSYVKKLRRVDMWARRINRTSSLLVSSFDPSYRSHLIY